MDDDNDDMPDSHVLAEAVIAEIERMTQAGEYDEICYTEPKCYVCCQPDSRDLVNRLIAEGMTNRDIAAACADINRKRAQAGDSRIISARGVWKHRKQHFNVDEPAAAVFRGIIERRAEEANKDFINGVGHAVTPYAVLEAIMVKGLHHIVDNNSVVGVREAMAAAAKLHELSANDAESRSRAQMMAKLERIISAAHELIPPERHEEFVARIEGREIQRELPTAQPVQTIREFNATFSNDEEDEL